MKPLISRMCLMIFVSAAILYGAESAIDLSKYPPPRPPLVMPPGTIASWSITAQKQGPGDRQPTTSRPAAAQVESLKSGDLKQDVITYNSGVREEIWYFQNCALSELSSRRGKIVVQSQGALEDPLEAKGAFRLLGNLVKSPGFPGFKWLDLRNYVGLELFNKTTPSYHYVLRGRDSDSGEELIAAEAWVDAETGAPLAYLAEGVLYVYNFRAATEGKVFLPPAFEAAYTKVRNMQDRQSRLEKDAAALR